MGWKTGVYCQQEHSHHDDTGSGAHPANDVQLQCSYIQLSVVRCMCLIHSTELELISSIFGNNMQRRTGPDVLPENFVVLNFRPSRCEPLKANPCLQFPIEPLKVRCENVTTHLHLALMLRMRAAIHSLPHTSSWCTTRGQLC